MQFLGEEIQRPSSDDEEEKKRKENNWYRRPSLMGHRDLSCFLSIRLGLLTSETIYTHTSHSALTCSTMTAPPTFPPSLPPFLLLFRPELPNGSSPVLLVTASHSYKAIVLLLVPHQYFLTGSLRWFFLIISIFVFLNLVAN